MFGSFYVSLSDDDSNDIEKMRVRVKRNWRKFAPRGRDNEIFRRIFWRSRQWWPILICVPVFALLLFEASRVRTKPTEDAKLNFVEKELKGNLNRMDMPMKSVNGTKKPRYSIWVDSKSQFRRDPLGGLKHFFGIQIQPWQFQNMELEVLYTMRGMQLLENTKLPQKKLKCN